MASKEQNKLLKAIISIKPKTDIICDYRPNYMKNKNTGKNYEIDIFFKKWDIGIEYQGAVHFKDIKHIRNNSDKAKYNDVQKLDIVNKTKGKFLVVEVFECDLKGDIIKNVALRFKNYAAYYYKIKLLSKYKMAFNMYLCLKYQIGHGFSVTKSHIQIFDINGNAIKRCFDIKKEKRDFWKENNINQALTA